MKEIDILKQEVKDAKQIQKFKDPEYLKLEFQIEDKSWWILSMEKKLTDSNRLILGLQGEKS